MQPERKSDEKTYSVHECQYESVINELKMTGNETRSILNTISSKLDRTEKQLEKIDKRLFIDNGTLSIQTQLREGNLRFEKIEGLVNYISEKISILDKDTEIKRTITEQRLTEKINETAKIPRTFAAYTMGFITFCGIIVTVVLWLIKNTPHTP